MTRRRWIAVTAGALVVGLILGAVIGRVVWPWSVGDDFWFAFWTGAPMAGILAIIAALIAFGPAYRSTRIAQENGAREQWWNRAQWALEMAASSRQSDREVANEALLALSAEATPMELAMITKTIAQLQDAGTEEGETLRTRQSISALRREIAAGAAEPISDREREQLELLRQEYERRFGKEAARRVMGRP